MKTYKVVIVEKDIYARNAINSYLAWDRRTRVMEKFKTLEQLTDYLSHAPIAELPDTILLDGRLLVSVEQTRAALAYIKRLCSADVLVLAESDMRDIANAVKEAGGRGYLHREDVGLQVSWLIVWAKNHPFVVSPQTAFLFPDAAQLPDGREYPELTDRVRQALMLCVVEGMSAELAADEMGLSPHTIRTYIKEGYSILEAADDTEYPVDLSAQERAFMRFTALALNHLDEQQHRKHEED
jgi:DNA-binding NarL/FixJ family response regulator